MNLIVGNLHAESDWAGDDRTPAAPGLDSAAAAATLLRVFAGREDSIWLPSRVSETRVAEIDGLPRCRLVVAYPTDVSARLAWAEVSGLPPWRPRRGRIGVDWIDALWQTRPSTVDVSRRVNHRRFAFGVEQLAGSSVGGGLAATVDDVRTIVSGIDGPWVAKAAHSAAGRLRVRADDAAALDAPAMRATVVRLLGRGELRIEPWHRRTRDVGVVGYVDEAVSIIGGHELVVDGQGRFRGAVTADPPTTIVDAARMAGRELHTAGYRGAFGIDAYEFDDDGHRATRPLVEINARLTFGHVLHAARARLHRSSLAIRFGKGAPPPDAEVAIAADGPDGVSAWLV